MLINFHENVEISKVFFFLWFYRQQSMGRHFNTILLGCLLKSKNYFWYQNLCFLISENKICDIKNWISWYKNNHFQFLILELLIIFRRYFKFLISEIQIKNWFFDFQKKFLISSYLIIWIIDKKNIHFWYQKIP